MTEHEEALTSGASPTEAQIGSALERAGTLSSIGIPHGLILDAESRNLAGAVRRGGEIVSLERWEYEVWLLLLTPLPDDGVAKAAWRRSWQGTLAVTERLLGSRLLVRNDPDDGMTSEMARLRPIPLGMGLGNRSGDPDRFTLQNASLSLPAPLSLDPIGTALWWNFDGATSLGAAVDVVSRQVGDLPRIAVECAAAVLVRDLMAHRLLYLDAPVPTG